MVKLDAEKKQVVFFVDEEPSAVAIDPEYDVPRKLTDDETPPLLAKLLSEEKPVLVTAATGTEIYAGAVAAWKQRGAEERQADTITDADVNESSFLAFGPDNPLVGRLYGRVETGNEALTLVAKKNPWNPDKVVVIVQAGTEQAASEALNAVLKESGEQVSIADLPEGSVSKKAGIKVGDIVVSLDNAVIRSVDDIRIALFYKKSEDRVRIKVERKRFLSGYAEIEFEVKCSNLL